MPSFSAQPLSVIIPTLDAAATLPAVLGALEEGRSAGLLREIVIVDGGSADGTAALATALGGRVIAAPRGRGMQLATGGAVAEGEWFLFLHADTRLGRGWTAPVAAFMADAANQRRAGYFRFALDDGARAARLIEAGVRWRCRNLALPYGDQGLLLSAALHGEVGGFRPLPLMEDVDIVRRIGRERLTPLAADAVTSAARYRRDGYLARPLRNLSCLTLYLLGIPPRLLLRLYG